MNKIRTVVWLVILSSLLCVACGRESQSVSGKVYNIYYVDNDETKTITREYVSETTECRELLGELLEQLRTIPSKFEYKAPLASGFDLIGFAIDNEQITMNFDEHYREMDSVREVLMRAAIVRTVTQISEISHVSFTIQGEPLTDSNGNAIGMMSSDLFIENAGNEINAYEKVNLHLYFANEDGTGLGGGKPQKRGVQQQYFSGEAGGGEAD